MDEVEYTVETTYGDGSIAVATYDDYAEAVSVFEQECGEHIAGARLLKVTTAEIARSKQD